MARVCSIERLADNCRYFGLSIGTRATLPSLSKCRPQPYDLASGDVRMQAMGLEKKADRSCFRFALSFGIEIEQCVRCGGRLKVIASIEEPELIERILAHRREWGEEAAPTAALGARAPPQASLF